MMNHSYAGFWIRFVAALVDGILVNIIAYAAGLMIGISYAMGATEVDETTLGVAGAIVGLGVFWLYHAIFESNAGQATPGKRLLDLKVTDDNGERLSFGRATGRTFAKYISLLPLMAGYLMAGWTQKKQALHDFMASTLVVYVPPQRREQAVSPSPAAMADSDMPQPPELPDQSEAVSRALTALHKLRADGAISVSDYETKKQQLLDRI